MIKKVAFIQKSGLIPRRTGGSRSAPRRLIVLLVTAVLAFPPCRAAAQTTGATTPPPTASVPFDTTGFPQWAKDMRRWEIVAFGTFPFTMLASTFFMDTWRWVDNTGMDWTENGRRYAPWPLKSAGAVNMTNQEIETTIMIAAGVSVAIAFVDLIIVQIKRHKEKRRAESLPVGNIIIDTRPWPEGSENGTKADNGGGPLPAEDPASP